MKKMIERIALIITAMGIIVLGVAYFETDTYIVTVTGKEVKNNSSTSTYQVFVEMEDGSSETFVVQDSIVKMRFDSSNMYGSLEEGETYEIETIGFRIPILSLYENIITAEEIEG